MKTRTIIGLSLTGLLSILTIKALNTETAPKQEPKKEIKVYYGCPSGMLYIEDQKTKQLQPTWTIDHEYLGKDNLITTKKFKGGLIKRMQDPWTD